NHIRGGLSAGEKFNSLLVGTSGFGLFLGFCLSLRFNKDFLGFYRFSVAYVSTRLSDEKFDLKKEISDGEGYGPSLRDGSREGRSNDGRGS
ncbi:MAG: hypothetical protein ACOYLQ_20685, partial [Hyphomicrobiaceae bacterium]